MPSILSGTIRSCRGYRNRSGYCCMCPNCGLRQSHLACGRADAPAIGDLNEYVERPEIEMNRIISSSVWGQTAPIAIHHELFKIETNNRPRQLVCISISDDYCIVIRKVNRIGPLYPECLIMPGVRSKDATPTPRLCCADANGKLTINKGSIRHMYLLLTRPPPGETDEYPS